MDFGVESFHPTIHHFRKAGVVGNIKDVDPCVSEVSGSATGGEDLNAVLYENVGYLQEIGFVVDADKRAFYFVHDILNFLAVR